MKEKDKIYAKQPNSLKVAGWRKTELSLDLNQLRNLNSLNMAKIQASELEF